jgi:bifunctional DNA-binding transcriptional regulator/antitoxin component of YhaV-PrlF toxin-antitoxin module
VTDYKKYSLGQLENFLHDAMSAAEATPQEIYDVIKGVVEENYYTYKHQASQAYELLALLNGNGKGHIKEYDDCMRPWGHSDLEALQYTEEEMDAMCDAAEAKDKVNKWIIPVDDDYNITFPEDLLEQTGWKEGDVLEWIDQGDGSFKLIKKEKKEHPSWVKGNELSKVKTYQEMIDDGWTMTDDGFWIKEN